MKCIKITFIFPTVLYVASFKTFIDDIRSNGYDVDQPLIIYQGAILDGWNRNKACVELGIKPPVKEFIGSELEAMQLVMRTNKRRNLNSGQWATIAVEAEDIMGAIAEQVEKEAETKRKVNAANQHTEPPVNLLTAAKYENATKAQAIAAEMFQTNRTYINQAAKIKQASPEIFEKVKAGEMTMQDATKAVRAIPTSPWTGDIARTSLEAGNSPQIIQTYYLELVTKNDGIAWFSVIPKSESI